LRKVYQSTSMGEREMFKAGRVLHKVERECGGG
jgi:hypothetical protein